MGNLNQGQALCAAAAFAILVGCSSDSAIEPKQALPQTGAHSLVSHYSCPTTGSLEYASDLMNNVVNVYAGNFAGQPPCGQITSAVHAPHGLYVQPSTHDLFVVNPPDFDVQVFHRGQLSPYNAYVNRYHELDDVTVALDGTVLAIGGGAIATWIEGPNGGTFVGRFPVKNHSQGWWITVKANGVVYFDVQNPQTKLVEVWSVRCPAGRCGQQTQVAGISFEYPSAIAIDDTGDLLAVNTDAINGTNNLFDTFELPNPSPSTFPLLPGLPQAMAINATNRHLFIADFEFNGDAAEYKYPSGTLVGTVPGNTGGEMSGIAVDP